MRKFAEDNNTRHRLNNIATIDKKEMGNFVHLHVHSQYSLLDGQASIPSLVDKAIADGMPGMALTDHGNMYGIKELFNYVADKNGKLAEGQEPFKIILGCEMYVAENSRFDHSSPKDKGRHLIVLAKNERGYHNLIKLVSRAWTEGYYYHPRTDKADLAAHSEGLIVASACLGGEIPKLLIAGDIEGAEKAVEWWKSVFGDDYYIELQRHKATVARANHDTYQLQRSIEPELIRIAQKYGIKIIATNDVHFTNEHDAEAHDRLICLSTGKYLSDADRMLYTKQEWFKTTEEMSQLFADIPEAVTNTMEILDKVEPYDIDHEPIMPNYAIPEEFGTEAEYRSRITEQELFDEFTRDEHGNVVLSQADAEKKIKKLGGYDKLYRIKFEADYLRKITYDGAAMRYGTPLAPEIKERIDFELHVMKTMGFPGYFLIVQDFIRAGRERLGVSIGPGRGSAAGSVVAYCLEITQIDPLKYDLLFERFLNPDRISLPDIDVDFDDDGREVVLHYVTEKYGENNVAHIITYGTMATKSAIKDVARVENLNLRESNRLVGLVPKRMPVVDGKEAKLNLKNCYEYLDDFKQELNSPDPLVRETLQYARELEGNVRNTGVHACGVIICRDDVTDWVPVSTATDKLQGKLLVTQYEGSVIEQTGLIKMDFLGLKTLSIIKEAVANIKHRRGIDIDMEKIPIDDAATYKLYCEGRTKGTFQFESPGMQKYLRELQPTVFEDLIAMNALYRPGPMDYIPEFIKRKHGRSPIVYDIPEMEKYLKDTYGITVYQEQVMLLSRLLAGFTRGESDALRKAMGKKKKAIVDKMKPKFIEGGKANGHDPKVLEKIWADWEKFASYAFNKSHATCYSWVAFQTAYLKANYPSEYMAAVLSRNLSDITKLTGFMDECKAMGIKVLGPDINESMSKFSVNAHGDIRFGLSAIKGIGTNVVEAIIKAREEGEPYKDIYDFMERVPSQALNKRVMENLALAGALDCFGIKREDLVSEESLSMEALLKYGARFQTIRLDRMTSLFGFDDEIVSESAKPRIMSQPPWPTVYKLKRERELVGMYLSGHPLDPYYMELNYGMTTLKALSESTPTDGAEVAFGGLVTDTKERTTQRGSLMRIVSIEDFTGSSEFALFDRQLREYGHYAVEGSAILVRGRYSLSTKTNTMRLNVESITPLEDIKGSLIKGITIAVDADKMSAILAKTICESAVGAADTPTDNPGYVDFIIYDPRSNRRLHMKSSLKIPITRSLVENLAEMELDFVVRT